VRTVTFGLGDGFNEELLQAMAAAGGGHFYFIEEAALIGDRFTSELGEALEVASRDVRLLVRAPGVRCEPLTAYAGEVLDADRTIVRVGDLSSEQVVELTFKLTFPDGAVGDSIEVLAQLFADGRVGPSLDNPLGDVPTHGIVRFTFADHGANDRQPRERTIDWVVAEKYAAQAMRVAVAKNREGDYEGARRALVGTAKKIGGYADGDEVLLGLIGTLMGEASVYSAPMPEMNRKRAYAHATSHLKGRDTSGRARKS